MLSQLADQMIEVGVATNAVFNGNVLVVTYSDGTTDQIDLGAWINAKLAPVTSVVAAWSAYMAGQGTNLTITYPTTGMVGVPFNWSVNNGPPNTDFALRSTDDPNSGLGVGYTFTTDAHGNYGGTSTPLEAGSFTATFSFNALGEIAKPIVVAANPSIPVVYTPNVSYPNTGVQNVPLSWAITGGKPNTAVKIFSALSGLSANVNLDQNGSVGSTSTPLGNGTANVAFTFADGIVVNKATNIFPAAGTVLSQYCSNFNLMRSIANGAGGQTEQLVNANDVATCGYVAPSQTSGVPLNLYSAVANGKSQCAMVFTKDGFWNTYEWTSPPGPNGTYTNHNGSYVNEAINPDSNPGNHYEIYAVIESYTVNGVPADSSPFAQYCGQRINLGEGTDGQGTPVSFSVDQTNNGPNISTGAQCVIKYHIYVTRIDDESSDMDFEITMTAAGACLSADTYLKTPTGDRMLATLKKGEIVSSYYAPGLIDSSVIGWETWTSPVDSTDIDTTQTAVIVDLQRFTADQTIKINGFHSTIFHTHLVASGGNYMWKRACDITYNDSLVTIDKQLMPVGSIERINEPHDFIFCNVEDLDQLIIRSTNTYILSHNAS